MTGGGAERVFAVLASGLAARGHDVILAVDFAANENRRMIDPAVRTITLSESHVVSVIRLAWLLIKERPDVALSALSISNLKLFLAALFTGQLSRTILGYHGYSVSEPQLISRLSYALTPLLTRFAAATVCVSDGLRRYVTSRWFGYAKRIHRIYNPVSTGPDASHVTREDLLARKPQALASGRLVDYKNFPLLVRAFAKVEPKSATLTILGQGPEQPRIQQEIDRLGLGDRVRLAGYAEEPWPYYQQASCFALSSNSESFGLVVVEALANGLPVITTDCDGPHEILEDEKYGRLTPIGDEDALAAAISAAFVEPGDPALRRARAQDFSLDTGLDRYSDLIAQVAARNRKPSLTREVALTPLPIARRERRP